MLAATLPTQVHFSPAPSLRPVVVQPHEARCLDAFGDRLDVVLSSADVGGGFGLACLEPERPRHEHPGRYPTRYTVAYDTAAHEYRVALDGLVPR